MFTMYAGMPQNMFSPPLPQLSNLHIWNIHFRTHDACYLFLPCMELRNNLNLLRQLYKNTSTYSTTTHLFQIQGVPRNMTKARRLEMSSGNFEFICDKITQFWLNDSILIFVKNLISIYRKYSANMIALIYPKITKNIYCCSFYGSSICDLILQGISKFYSAQNTAIRIPEYTHRC